MCLKSLRVQSVLIARLEALLINDRQSLISRFHVLLPIMQIQFSHLKDLTLIIYSCNELLKEILIEI